MPDGNRKPESEPPDPEAMTKLLELELMQKRAAWQQSKQRLGALRVVSFLFLFLVIVAAFLAFWFLFSSGRMSRPNQSEDGPSLTAPSPGATPQR